MDMLGLILLGIVIVIPLLGGLAILGSVLIADAVEKMYYEEL